MQMVLYEGKEEAAKMEFHMITDSDFLNACTVIHIYSILSVSLLIDLSRLYIFSIDSLICILCLLCKC